MKMHWKEDSTQDLTASQKREKKMVQSVRKWLKQITSTKEVLRHITEARNLASLSSALACSSLLKMSHRTLPFHMPLGVRIQIFNIGKLISFILGADCV